MSSTRPCPQCQLRMLLGTSSRNKYFAFISGAQWKHFSKLLPRWYLVLLWVSSPCSWLSNGQTWLIVILKEKEPQTRAVFLQSRVALLMYRLTATLPYKWKAGLLKMSPFYLLTSAFCFIQTEEGVRLCGEEKRTSLLCVICDLWVSAGDLHSVKLCWLLKIVYLTIQYGRNRAERDGDRWGIHRVPS